MALIALFSLSNSIATADISVNSEGLAFRSSVSSDSGITVGACDMKLAEVMPSSNTVIKYIMILKPRFVLPSTKYIMYTSNKYSLIKFMVYCNDTVGLTFPEYADLFARCVEVQIQINFHTAYADSVNKYGPHLCYVDMPYIISHVPMHSSEGARDRFFNESAPANTYYDEESGNDEKVFGLCIPIADPIEMLALSSVDEKSKLDIYPHPCFDIKQGGDGKFNTGGTIVNNCAHNVGSVDTSVPCHFKALSKKLDEYYTKMFKNDMVHTEGSTKLPVYWDPIVSRIL